MLPRELVEQLDELDRARCNDSPEEKNKLSKAKKQVMAKYLKQSRIEHIAQRMTKDLIRQRTRDASVRLASRFDVVKRFLPSRSLLAHTLWDDITDVYSNQGRLALQALIDLLGEDSGWRHPRGLEPHDRQ